MSSVRLIWVTPEAEKIITYCARVSNPANQNNEKIDNLLKYCIRKKHWSVFEMADMCVEIVTSRAISAQIRTHMSFWSFSFQEFSQRYAAVDSFEEIHPRRQDLKNRQNSFDDLSQEDIDWFMYEQKTIVEYSSKIYREALDRGIAKESARFILPINVATRMYMKGSVRSWIHYLETRSSEETQLEHREIANQIKAIFCEQFPIVAGALGWL